MGGRGSGNMRTWMSKAAARAARQLALLPLPLLAAALCSPAHAADPLIPLSGVYDIRIYGQPNPNYSLSLKIPRIPDPKGDWAEPNDAATAYDLREVQGARSLDNLSIHTESDQDWFTFSTAAAGRDGDLVRIDFERERRGAEEKR